ncbi:MAG: hypothetical protein A3F18_01510 [Legionellales bacterium RIFCSPHIGHO2_12_FULL_37_14]|nr:MAG: hypothetical protein A3F18_01510 [Legionellales bacterium RIFCSPHIGHO2_12_FULL_37_14]
MRKFGFKLSQELMKKLTKKAGKNPELSKPVLAWLERIDNSTSDKIPKKISEEISLRSSRGG